MNTFTTIKNLSQLHFTLIFFYFLSLIISTIHFTLLCYTYLQFTSFYFTSSHFFTFSPSLLLTILHTLNLVLKLCALPWEVNIAPSGSFVQSVMDPFTNEYFPMNLLCFLALNFRYRSTHLK